MDGNELTPWEELGPVKPTPPALDERGERHWLRPGCYTLRVTVNDAIQELTRSLAMVCPTGMTEEDRTQWIAAAASTIRDADISPNDFTRAAARARLDPTCDHPAKVVPAIIRALGESWRASLNWDWTPEQVAARNAEDAEREAVEKAFIVSMKRLERCEMTQPEIDELPDRVKRVADCRMILRKHDDGIYRYWKHHAAQSAA